MLATEPGDAGRPPRSKTPGRRAARRGRRDSSLRRPACASRRRRAPPTADLRPAKFRAGCARARRELELDPVALAGARAIARPRVESGPFLAAPLPSLDASIVELDELDELVRSSNAPSGRSCARGSALR